MIVLFVAASAFVFTKFNGAGKKEVDVVSQLLPRKTSLSYAT
jgi:hypothetical protein